MVSGRIYSLGFQLHDAPCATTCCGSRKFMAAIRYGAVGVVFPVEKTGLMNSSADLLLSDCRNLMRLSSCVPQATTTPGERPPRLSICASSWPRPKRPTTMR